ncbi:MAG TPA: proprotein convertase P-domain-containing protein [Candidatus Binatia bacterium]|jgi:subtilisin-like proprotein convertase family protein|nr:proprotein convertase P-domain-containing protein [Candidatus Binatia bacterium]
MRTSRCPVTLACALLVVGAVRAWAASGPPPIDLTQSASMVPTALTSTSCNAGPYHRENSYYRVFDLASSLGGLAPLWVTSVEFGVEQADDGPAGLGQPVGIRLYTAAALPPTVAGLTLVATTTTIVTDQVLTTVTVPIGVSVPRTALLVVEIFTPDATVSGDLFYLGANSAGQTAPSYMRAPGCAIPEIEQLSSLGIPLAHWVMAVHGRLDLPLEPPMCVTDYRTFDNTTPVGVVDAGVMTSTIFVSGIASYLYDVNVRTMLRHTFAADVDVTLQSPAGTVVTLTTDNGAGSDDVFDGTVWDDDANPGGQVPYTANDGLVTDHTYLTGVVAPRLVPEEGLAAFMGEDPNGTWTLTVSDDLAGETGTLDAWTLELTAIDSTPQWDISARSNSTPVVIPTGPGVVTSTIEVSGLPPYMSLLTLETYLTHSFSADLDVTLESPAGTVVTITTDNGLGHDNVFNGTGWSAFFDPDGQVPYANNEHIVTDRAFADLVVAPSLTPEESFGAFTGEDPNGTWTLTVSDDIAGDGGSLNAWNLYISSLACVTTTTTSSSSTSTSSSSTTTSSTPTTSTTPGGATTTTTLPPGGCLHAATTDSVRCRLAAMMARVATDVPAPATAKLTRLLSRADASVATAATAGPTTPPGRRALRKAIRFVRKFDRKLGSGLGRAVSGGARTVLHDDASGVLADLPAVS